MALITSLSTEDLERFSSKAVAFACAGFASSPFTERSEELRLASVCLCCKLLARTMVLSTSITCVNMCVEPLTAALTMGLGDAFPDMKQACASAVTLLSRLAPQHLCGRFVATIRALSANISHQHAKTRLATLEALAFLFQTQHVNVDDREQLRSSLISSFQCTLCDRSYATDPVSKLSIHESRSILGLHGACDTASWSPVVKQAKFSLFADSRRGHAG